MATKPTKRKTTIKKLIEDIKPQQPPVEDLISQLENVSTSNKMMMTYHLNKVKETTGEILVEDVSYCMRLDQRIQNKLMKDLTK